MAADQAGKELERLTCELVQSKNSSQKEDCHFRHS